MTPAAELSPPRESCPDLREAVVGFDFVEEVFELTLLPKATF